MALDLSDECFNSNYIDGAFVPVASGATYETISPSSVSSSLASSLRFAHPFVVLVLRVLSLHSVLRFFLFAPCSRFVVLRLALRAAPSGLDA